MSSGDVDRLLGNPDRTKEFESRTGVSFSQFKRLMAELRVDCQRDR